MPSTSPSVEQLKRALAISEQISSLEAELASILGGQAAAPVKARRGRPPAVKPDANGDAQAAAPAKPRKKKRKKMSPEGLAAIVAAQKARWARQKRAVDAATASDDKKDKAKK